MTSNNAQYQAEYKMNTNFIDDYQNQLREWQDRAFDTWFAVFPGKGEKVDVSKAFERVLNLQQEFWSSTIKAQQATVQLGIEAQQKFVNNYFSILRRAPIPNGRFEYEYQPPETKVEAEGQMG